MATNSLNTIYILADSYGGVRVQNNVTEVALNDTYPYKLKNEFKNKEISIDTASYRKITDLPNIIKGLDHNYGLYILQAGIVDCYPRPLSQKFTVSQSFLAKVLRRIIRMNRKFFINYIHNKPWSTVNEVENSLATIFNQLPSKKIIFINIAPVNNFQNNQTPKANEQIAKYNEAIKRICSQFSNVQLIDVHATLLSDPEMESYLNPKDSHLNIKGNKLYSKLISEALHKL